MIKLIVWDLDGIIWTGNLSETGDIATVNQNVIDFIKNSEKSGIIHSVCSKNDLNQAKNILKNIDLWDLFVFPNIDFVPKGKSVKKIIENCQLREQDVLFVDDNPINVNEVKYYCPEIQTQENISFIDSFLIPEGKSRTDFYKILEFKSTEKDNINFLESSDIKISICNEDNCFLFYDRICELVNRSNRLNFTKTRFEDMTLMNMPYGHIQNRMNYVVFAWDKYGYYGLIGYFSTNIEHNKIEHFVFSCRVLDMGIEQCCYEFIKKHTPYKFDIDISPRKIDYINLVDYSSFRDFIHEKEKLPLKSKEPKAKIYAGCLSLPIWSNCKLNYLLDYGALSGPGSLIKNQEIDNLLNDPDMIIISVMAEISDESIEADYPKNCLEKLIQNGKKITVILPEKLLSPTDYQNDIYNKWYKCVKEYNINHIFIPVSSDHQHFNRLQLSNLAGYLDVWMKNNL